MSRASDLISRVNESESVWTLITTGTPRIERPYGDQTVVLEAPDATSYKVYFKGASSDSFVTIPRDGNYANFAATYRRKFGRGAPPDMEILNRLIKASN